MKITIILLLIFILSGCSSDEVQVAMSMLGNNDSDNCNTNAPVFIDNFKSLNAMAININYTHDKESYAQSCKKEILIADKNIPVNMNLRTGSNKTWITYSSNLQK